MNTGQTVALQPELWSAVILIVYEGITIEVSSTGLRTNINCLSVRPLQIYFLFPVLGMAYSCRRAGGYFVAENLHFNRYFSEVEHPHIPSRFANGTGSNYIFNPYAPDMF